MSREFIRIERRSAWYRPYYLSTNTHMYRVNSFVFFNPLTEIITSFSELVLTFSQPPLKLAYKIGEQNHNTQIN